MSQSPSALPPSPTPNPALQWAKEWSQFAWSIMRDHVRRAFRWNLQTVPVLTDEQAQLAAAGVTDPSTQRYLAWRRSLLLCVIGPLALSAILKTIDAAHLDLQGYTDTGKSLTWLMVASHWAMPAAAIWALMAWRDAHRSHIRILWGWAIGFITPFMLGLVPIEDLISLEGANADAAGQQMMVIKAVLAVTYYINLLPLILTLLPALVRAAVRIKTIAPGATIPGWFLTLAAPLNAALWIALLIAFNAFAGGPLLVAGVIAFVAGPLLYVWRLQLIVRPQPSSALEPLGVTQKQAITTMLCGLAAVVIFAFTHKVFGRHIIGTGAETSFIRPWDLDLYRFILEYLARSLFMTALFADLLLRITISSAKTQREFAATTNHAAHEEAINGLSAAIKPLG